MSDHDVDHSPMSAGGTLGPAMVFGNLAGRNAGDCVAAGRERELA